MSTKPPPATENLEERQEQGTSEEVLLRDESDEIIDNLKSQLNALQKQLVRHRREEQVRAREAVEPDAVGLPAGWQTELTPHIASRLQMPAEELTARLERLIEQINDPDLRAELERSRDTAYFLFDTFRRISEKHEALTQSLSADAVVLEMTEFRRRLEQSMAEWGLPMTPEAEGPLPDRITLAPQSVITVLITLVNLAADLFGPPSRVEISCPGLTQSEDREMHHLRLRIGSEQEWEGPRADEDVATVAIRAGVRSPAVVDLLYVEKIIEMRGGTLGFHRRQGRVHGFEVLLPVAG